MDLQPPEARRLTEPEAIAAVIRLRYSLFPETQAAIAPLLAKFGITGSAPRALVARLAKDSAAVSLLKSDLERRDPLLSGYAKRLMIAADNAASKLLFDGLVARIASFFEGAIDYNQFLRFVTVATRSGDELRFVLQFLDRNILATEAASDESIPVDSSDYVAFLDGILPQEEEEKAEFRPEAFEDIIGGDDIDLENAIIVGKSYHDLLFFYETMKFGNSTPEVDFVVNRRYFNAESTAIVKEEKASKNFDRSVSEPLQAAASEKLHDTENVFELLLNACLDLNSGNVTRTVVRMVRLVYDDQADKVVSMMSNEAVRKFVRERLFQAAVKMKITLYRLLRFAFVRYSRALQRVIPHPYLVRPAMELVVRIAGSKMDEQLKRQLRNVRRIIKKAIKATTWGPKLSDRRNVALVSRFCAFYKEYLQGQEPPIGFTAPKFYENAVVDWSDVLMAAIRKSVAELSSTEAKKASQRKNQREKRWNLRSLVDDILSVSDYPLLEGQPVQLLCRLRDQNALEFVLENPCNFRV